jgi:hypothetical protein
MVLSLPVLNLLREMVFAVWPLLRITQHDSLNEGYKLSKNTFSGQKTDHSFSVPVSYHTTHDNRSIACRAVAWAKTSHSFSPKNVRQSSTKTRTTEVKPRQTNTSLIWFRLITLLKIRLIQNLHLPLYVDRLESLNPKVILDTLRLSFSRREGVIIMLCELLISILKCARANSI